MKIKKSDMEFILAVFKAAQYKLVDKQKHRLILYSVIEERNVQFNLSISPADSVNGIDTIVQKCLSFIKELEYSKAEKETTEKIRRGFCKLLGITSIE